MIKRIATMVVGTLLLACSTAALAAASESKESGTFFISSGPAADFKQIGEQTNFGNWNMMTIMLGGDAIGGGDPSIDENVGLIKDIGASYAALPGGCGGEKIAVDILYIDDTDYRVNDTVAAAIDADDGYYRDPGGGGGVIAALPEDTQTLIGFRAPEVAPGDGDSAG
jgi:hypothetical protein